MVQINPELLWKGYGEEKLRRGQAASAEAHGAMPSEMAGMPEEFQVWLMATIAHELGHAVNMMHHAEPDDTAPASDPPVDSVSNQEISTRVFEEGITALPHGPHSGDLNCIMTFFETPYKYLGPDGLYYEYPYELVPVPKDFCSSKAGTLINSPSFTPPAGDARPYPVCGDAAWGNCRSMLI
jgi:hypothetical protein